MATDLVIDAHVHTYPTPEIGLQAQAGGGHVGCFGTPEELLGIMDAAGIRSAVQANVTPARSMYEAGLAALPEAKREQGVASLVEKISGRIRRRNEWTCRVSAENPRLVPFISVDPLMGTDAMVAEIEDKATRLGAKGVKIHPNEGRFFPSDPGFLPVFETAHRLGLPVLSHGGLGGPDQPYARPSGFTAALEAFPGVVLQIAHLGYKQLEESVELAHRFENVCFDTSAVVSAAEGRQFLTDEDAVTWIRKIGVGRVMFGSDFPWFHPGRDLERFLGLGFDEAERAALVGGNAKRILNL